MSVAMSFTMLGSATQATNFFGRGSGSTRSSGAAASHAAKAGARMTVKHRRRSTIVCASDRSSLSELEAAPLAAALACSEGVPDLYAATSATAEAVQQLVHAGVMNGAAASFAGSDGVWEVFYAPHIQGLSTTFAGVKFRPLRYTISQNGTVLRSDVRYSSSLFGSGWLSSEGTIKAAESNARVDLVFESFWVKGGGNDDDPSPGNPVRDSGGNLSVVDALVNAVGRAGFISQLAVFPVLYFNQEAGVCVFRFPPLRSNIATRRRGPAPPAAA